jgi:hypothetical protein
MASPEKERKRDAETERKEERGKKRREEKRRERWNRTITAVPWGCRGMDFA